MTKICVLVLGMHRSGTSAFTRLLNLAGATVPRHLMRQQPDNERGFWESERIVALNDRLLQYCDSRWDDWRAVVPSRHLANAPEDFDVLIAETIEDEFGDAELIVLKDPRICRFAPLYIRALNRLGYQVVFFHVLRDPRAVAASLGKRNGIATMQSCLLWMRHQLDAEMATRGERRGFFTYEELMRNWRSIAGKAASILSLPSLAPDEPTMAEMDSFLSSELHHHASGAPLPGVSEVVSTKIDAIYALFDRLSVDPSDSIAQEGLDAARGFLDEMSLWAGEAQYATVSNLETKLTRLNRESEAKEAGLRDMLAAAKEQVRASAEKVSEIEASLQTALANAAITKAQLLDTVKVAHVIDVDLCKARKHPLSSLWRLIKFRVLRTVSKDYSPLPTKMKHRFAKSAAKVNPSRSLFEEHLARQARPKTQPNASGSPPES